MVKKMSYNKMLKKMRGNSLDNTPVVDYAFKVINMHNFKFMKLIIYSSMNFQCSQISFAMHVDELDGDGIIVCVDFGFQNVMCKVTDNLLSIYSEELIITQMADVFKMLLRNINYNVPKSKEKMINLADVVFAPAE